MNSWFLLAVVVCSTLGPWAILDAPKAVRAIRRRAPRPADEGGEVDSIALACNIFAAELSHGEGERLLATWSAAAQDEAERRKDGAA